MSDDVIDLTLSSDHEDVDDASLKQLHIAIASVPEARLRKVVDKVVDNDRAVRHALLKELVTVKKRTLKVVPRYETCVMCQTEFDASEERDEDECCYHPGKCYPIVLQLRQNYWAELIQPGVLNVDYGMFVDWDEDCHGPMDTRSNRREYPENFKWSCCSEDGTTDGCLQRKHTSSNKKRRV